MTTLSVDIMRADKLRKVNRPLESAILKKLLQEKDAAMQLAEVLSVLIGFRHISQIEQMYAHTECLVMPLEPGIEIEIPMALKGAPGPQHLIKVGWLVYSILHAEKYQLYIRRAAIGRGYQLMAKW